jgi:hypothetical protein
MAATICYACSHSKLSTTPKAAKTANTAARYARSGELARFNNHAAIAKHTIAELKAK